MNPPLIQGDPHNAHIQWPQVPASPETLLGKEVRARKVVVHPSHLDSFSAPSATDRATTRHAGTLWPWRSQPRNAHKRHLWPTRQWIQCSSGCQLELSSPQEEGSCAGRKGGWQWLYSLFSRALFPFSWNNSKGCVCKGCSRVKYVAQGRNFVSFLFFIFFCRFRDSVFQMGTGSWCHPIFCFWFL